MGAHFKNAVALSIGEQIIASQHVGDLESEPAFDALRRVSTDLQHLYDARPTHVVADLHPDFLSTQLGAHLAASAPQRPRFTQVQHHFAHVLAGMLDNRIAPPCLGVAWDGTGLGPDGTVWGGEFLAIHDGGFARVASLRPFQLPGGDKAVREPRRSALGVLQEVYGEAWNQQEDLPPVRAFSARERSVLARVLTSRLNTQTTTSAGRLFDAVAAILGVRQSCKHEAQAALELEHLALSDPETGSYPMPLVESRALGSGSLPAHTLITLDWIPMVRALIADLRTGIAVPTLAARFHRSLAAGIAAVAGQCGQRKVVLSGGCFQNSLLLELTVQSLRDAGLQPYWHQRIPSNDGGIAVGQAAAVLSILNPNASHVPGDPRQTAQH
jgi:hydrogenase maturation protein HypF